MTPSNGPLPVNMVIAALQGSADNNYKSVVLPTWESENEAYISQGEARQASGEPVITLPPPIPLHTVYSTDANGNITTTQVVDPSLKLAVIPPPTPQVVPTTDIVAPQTGMTEQQYLDSLLTIAVETQQMVQAIKTKVGA